MLAEILPKQKCNIFRLFRRMWFRGDYLQFLQFLSQFKQSQF